MAKKMVMKMVEVHACDRCGCEILIDDGVWQGADGLNEVCESCYDDIRYCDCCCIGYFPESKEWIDGADMCYSCCMDKALDILKALHNHGEDLNAICKQVIKS